MQAAPTRQGQRHSPASAEVSAPKSDSSCWAHAWLSPRRGLRGHWFVQLLGPTCFPAVALSHACLLPATARGLFCAPGRLLGLQMFPPKDKARSAHCRDSPLPALTTCSEDPITTQRLEKQTILVCLYPFRYGKFLQAGLTGAASWGLPSTLHSSPNPVQLRHTNAF